MIQHRWIVALALLLCLVSGAALAAGDATWALTVLGAETTTNLSSTQFYVQYGGDLEEVAFNAQPTDGNVFLLLQMTIEKERAGKGVFAWADLSVRDAGGNAFARHKNDTFLESHSLKRIKSTDLTFGKHEGFLCFELPAASAAGELTLVYAPEGGEKVEIPVEVTPAA